MLQGTFSNATPSSSLVSCTSRGECYADLISTIRPSTHLSGGKEVHRGWHGEPHHRDSFLSDLCSSVRTGPRR